MSEKWCEKNIRREIQIKREELNKILLEGLDKDKILRFSQELDLLINKYYSLYIQDKKQQIV
ncbi:aspartyl-phosphate phosphatase Spo0E family protein [Tissierella praeacuta]|uniref:Spo0E like sporulation regulatory protein n=1 Tax=Tissierella praeacuta DSM 18095 TaxID=1123404 RepID=A0A1M4W3W6_9FIRM|nr:aspartyl-phosphate phosphatase Spo0E family protein [Tissierella praeacuta]HAE92869.1 aspartyl-phosphate phosphatase Spo0E family protein [Tissierella sp.]MBU5256185.1 aspartyl-phosphate phosphatase Spo0E family protein [Tissierella praeacuta]TCU75642.1 Spo0E like sporulation regulatory protein [Tissierella praeacuta]SHE75803.1 Spo0E like sporulation regulatory protein [Tissierella praeacuta DSM 18095]SUP00140.1 Spo0E like sporulation regulatory protein [Tissierella praeacuta]